MSQLIIKRIGIRPLLQYGLIPLLLAGPASGIVIWLLFAGRISVIERTASYHLLTYLIVFIGNCTGYTLIASVILLCAALIFNICSRWGGLKITVEEAPPKVVKMDLLSLPIQRSEEEAWSGQWRQNG